MGPVKIRPLTAEDGAGAGHVFFDAVHRGTADVYSKKQREAWAGRRPDEAGWRDRLAETGGYAADADGALVGFMTLDQAGFIDLAFVRADFAGRGVGKLLYAAVEERAVAERIESLTTEASLKARGFFERMGWRVEAEQVVVKRGVSLTNYKMCKALR